MIIHDISDDACLGPDGLVRDGHGIRVPMAMRDSARGDIVLHGGGGARPGFCAHADAGLRDAGERARAEMISEMRDAWRGTRHCPPHHQVGDSGPEARGCPSPNGVRDSRRQDEMERAWQGAPKPPKGDVPVGPGPKAGMSCTVNGQRGRLVESGDRGWLRCEPVSDDGDDGVTDAIAHSATSVTTGDTVAAAQRVRDAAYHRMVADLRDAWRGTPA
jgi:hypothetical protein